MFAGEELWKSPTTSYSKQDCCQQQIGSAVALSQQVMKTSRGGDPTTTSLGVSSTHILLGLFLRIYSPPLQPYQKGNNFKMFYSTHHPW